MSKNNLSEQIEDLETKTDLVDDALHYGIKARFHRYLEAMSDLKLVDEVVETQMASITKLRDTNADLAAGLRIIKDKVVIKKKRQTKMKSVLDILSAFEQINASLNLINANVKAEDYSEAAALYKKQEEVLYNKLKGYCLTEKFEAKLNATRLQMIANCGTYFREKVSGYLSECLHFSTKKPEGVGDTSRLLQEMTLIANSSLNVSLDVSVLERFEVNSVPLYLLGSFEPTNKTEVEQMATVLSNFLSIKDFMIDEIVGAEIGIQIQNRIKEVVLDQADSCRNICKISSRRSLLNNSTSFQLFLLLIQ